MNTGARGRKAALVLVAMIAASGCSGTHDPSQTRESSAEHSGRAAPLQPVVLPELSAVAPRVQQQLRERYEAVAAGGADVSSEKRAARYGDLGNVLLAATFFDEAALAYAHAAALQPDEMTWPYLRGHALVRKGDREEAARAFTRAAELQPGYVPALVWLGDMYLDLGRTDAARNAFQRALASQPDAAAALFGAGRAALAAAAYADAAQHMEHALRAAPHATAINYPLAMAYRGLGQRERADAFLKTRGTTPPSLDDPVLDRATVVLDTPVSHENAGMQALRNQDWPAAIDAFRRGLQVAPDDPSLRYWMATAMIASGDRAGAEREFRTVTSAHPDFAKAHFSLAAMLDQQGRREDAVREYERAVQADPTMVDARVRLGDTLRTLERLRPAMTQYEAAVDLDPTVAAAWLGGAQTLIALGDTARALDWIARGKRLHPGRPEWAPLEAAARR